MFHYSGTHRIKEREGDWRTTGVTNMTWNNITNLCRISMDGARVWMPRGLGCFTHNILGILSKTHHCKYQSQTTGGHYSTRKRKQPNNTFIHTVPCTLKISTQTNNCLPVASQLSLYTSCNAWNNLYNHRSSTYRSDDHALERVFKTSCFVTSVFGQKIPQHWLSHCFASGNFRKCLQICISYYLYICKNNNLWLLGSTTKKTT